MNIKELADKSDKKVARLFLGKMPSSSELIDAGNNAFASLVILACAEMVCADDAKRLREVARKVFKP